MLTSREQLLLKMYDQMFADINQHINVVWQSIGTMVGTFAFLSLADKDILSIDVALSLIVLLAGWLCANLIDASYWYNRNLMIIANIERQFLQNQDLKDIHYYFGKHRPNNKMIAHLFIQLMLGLTLSLLVLVYHFFERVTPGLNAPLASFQFSRALPYIVALICLIFLHKLHKNYKIKYQEFIANSPGKEVDSTGINYGLGHGFAGRNETEEQGEAPK